MTRISDETRVRHTAKYLYPGSFFAEEVYRELDEPTFEAAVAAGPDEQEGYFRKDGWYAVKIRSTIQKRFVSADGDAMWSDAGDTKTTSFVVGSKIHVDNIPDTDLNRILRSNIRSNSDDGYGVYTRCRNWQIASDYDEVVSPSQLPGNDS